MLLGKKLPKAWFYHPLTKAYLAFSFSRTSFFNLLELARTLFGCCFVSSISPNKSPILDAFAIVP